MDVSQTQCSEPPLRTTFTVRQEMPDYISAALEETEEPGVHVKETINNGYKWTLELIL